VRSKPWVCNGGCPRLGQCSLCTPKGSLSRRNAGFEALHRTAALYDAEQGGLRLTQNFDMPPS
jgi:hypothetical protein